MPNALVSLPVPLIPALLSAVLAVMLWRQEMDNRVAARLFAALFAQSAVLSLLVALRFQYGLHGAAPVQIVLTLLTGPLLYLGFAGFTQPPDELRRHAIWHFAAVVMFLITWQLSPLSVLPDIAISASYLFYAALLLRLWLRGEDALAYTGLDQIRNLRLWMLGAVGFLIFLMIVDTAIAISFAHSQGTQARRMISWASALMIPALSLLVLAFSRLPKTSAPTARRVTPTGDQTQAETIEATARDLLNSSRLYLDPDLSLERLAKRLHLPVRDLSAAINTTQGKNVSQYVNSFRLEHAATLLVTTDDSVADIMGQSGFLTRSNFYREFQRVYGMSPAAFRKSRNWS